MNNNPLTGYFRCPAIHMTLPSGGHFYPPGSLEMPETGELPVYPMTAIDDITYKTPDALFNGSAVINVIKSCIPSIKDPWEIPSTDLPAILSNIRIASLGHIMEIDTQCPKCEELATYEIDLREVSDSLRSPDYTIALDFGDMKVFLKPLSYKQVNENSKLSFDDQNLQNILSNTEIIDDEKIKLMTDAYNKIANYSLETIANNIGLIQIPEADVTEFEYILDFLKHCEKSIYKRIKDKIIENRDLSEIKPIKIHCDNKKCNHDYEQPFTMDMSNFFE